MARRYLETSCRVIKIRRNRIFIVDIDHGVGLMRKSSENFSVPDMHDDLSNAQFDRFIDEQRIFQ